MSIYLHSTTICERHSHLTLVNPGSNIPGSVDMLVRGNLHPFLLQSQEDIIHTTDLPLTPNT